MAVSFDWSAIDLVLPKNLHGLIVDYRNYENWIYFWMYNSRSRLLQKCSKNLDQGIIEIWTTVEILGA